MFHSHSRVASLHRIGFYFTSAAAAAASFSLSPTRLTRFTFRLSPFNSTCTIQSLSKNHKSGATCKERERERFPPHANMKSQFHQEAIVASWNVDRTFTLVCQFFLFDLFRSLFLSRSSSLFGSISIYVCSVMLLTGFSASQTSQINDASCVAFKVPNDRPTLQYTHHSTESSALPYYSLFVSLSLSLSLHLYCFLSLSLSSNSKINTSTMLFNKTLLPLSLFPSLVQATKRNSFLLPLYSLCSSSFFCLSQSNLNQPSSHTCTSSSSLWPGLSLSLCKHSLPLTRPLFPLFPSLLLLLLLLLSDFARRSEQSGKLSVARENDPGDKEAESSDSWVNP